MLYKGPKTRLPRDAQLTPRPFAPRLLLKSSPSTPCPILHRMLAEDSSPIHHTQMFLLLTPNVNYRYHRLRLEPTARRRSGQVTW